MTDAGAGHNSGVGGQILQIIEQVEHIESEIKDLNTDKSEIFKGAKGSGLDVTAIKKIVAMRRMDAGKRREAEEILDLYLTSIGWVP